MNTFNQFIIIYYNIIKKKVTNDYEDNKYNFKIVLLLELQKPQKEFLLRKENPNIKIILSRTVVNKATWKIQM